MCLNSDWLSSIVYRSVAHRRYGLGERVPPNWNSRVGCSPAGMEKENLWRREVKKRNNSILASCSPIHTRFPKDAQYNKSETLGLSLKKVCGILIFPCFSSLATSGLKTKLNLGKSTNLLFTYKWIFIFHVEKCIPAYVSRRLYFSHTGEFVKMKVTLK